MVLHGQSRRPMKRIGPWRRHKRLATTRFSPWFAAARSVPPHGGVSSVPVGLLARDFRGLLPPPRPHQPSQPTFHLVRAGSCASDRLSPSRCSRSSHTAAAPPRIRTWFTCPSLRVPFQLLLRGPRPMLSHRLLRCPSCQARTTPARPQEPSLLPSEDNIAYRFQISQQVLSALWHGSEGLATGHGLASFAGRPPAVSRPQPRFSARRDGGPLWQESSGVDARPGVADWRSLLQQHPGCCCTRSFPPKPAEGRGATPCQKSRHHQCEGCSRVIG